MYLARCAATAAAIALLQACSEPPSARLPGYAEGEYVYVAAASAGRLESLPVTRGEWIERGRSLFRLEAQDTEHAMQQGYQQWQAAGRQLEDMRKGKRPLEIAPLRAQVEQAGVSARRARQQAERDRDAYTDGSVSLAQLQASEAASATDEAKLREARSQLAAAALPTRADQILAQQAQASAAFANYQRLRWQYEQTRVAALQGGLVVDTLYRVGEWVPAGSPVVKLLPAGHVKARFFIAEAGLAALKPGQAVTVHCEGCAAGLAATVAYISAQAEYAPPVIYSDRSKSKLVYMAEARLRDGQAARLHPGQPVEVQP